MSLSEKSLSREQNNLFEISCFSKSVCTALEDLDDGIAIINREYEIVWANKSFVNIFSKKCSNQILGAKCFDLLNNNKSICNDCLAQNTFEGCHIDKHVIMRQARLGGQVLDGKKIVLKEMNFPLIDENGTITHVLIYLKDFTYEAALEEQLRSSDRLVGVGKLAAGIAHEIRNPLGNITAAAQYFLKKAEADSEIKKYLKIILRNSERMNKIIKELLNFAKPHEVSFTIGSVDKVIDNVFRLVKARLLKQHIQFYRNFSKHQPKMLLDEKILEEVFLNLILNAIEAMPKGGKLAVTVHAGENDNKVVINIADTGVGISEDNLNNIFEPFFTTKKDGTGFGLSFVQHSVDMHNGKVEVKSKLGYGTEVTIILPSYQEVVL
ncbi:MAG: GHKL domain-containing protein [Ignavibacteriales bacterium]|nr:GHKL domain-containing protein [Ignavibacteriales bacterium]